MLTLKKLPFNLYISFDRPQNATDSEMTEDGFLLRYRGEQLFGVTILDALIRAARNSEYALIFGNIRADFRKVNISRLFFWPSSILNKFAHFRLESLPGSKLNLIISSLSKAHLTVSLGV
uniref:Uncharacterized protein n=1 Tax=Candidatus Kentrum sp. LPFa TaxID=2126335 RepID=A0A450WM61_9GAMM|nr:MAG: hypothetical protein BECKLPF1236B_GA0070989_11344 [Candidatus Kentron sp. LPFa]